MQELIRNIPGVLDTKVGYTGGWIAHPIYDDIKTGKTGHAEAIKMAEKIATMSAPAIKLIKDAVNKAEELSLTEGLSYEKRNFYLLFGTEDKAEGMKAFIEKRKPEWKGQ